VSRARPVAGVLRLAGEGFRSRAIALGQRPHLALQSGDLFAQLLFARGGRIGLQSHLGVEQGLPGAFQSSASASRSSAARLISTRASSSSIANA